MSLRFRSRFVLAFVALSPRVTNAQEPIDSALARYINGIRAIDDHAHPLRPVVPGAPADTDFDALPLDGIPSFDLPSRLKGDNQIWRAAQQALYHVPSGSTDAA